MKKLLESVIEALSKIQVSGKENLNLLLGCIITLEKIAETCKTTVKEIPLEGVVPNDSHGEGESIPCENNRPAGSAE